MTIDSARRIHMRLARKHNAEAVKVAKSLRKQGVSWQQIAYHLTSSGFLTRRGNAWRKSTIHAAVKAQGVKV